MAFGSDNVELNLILKAKAEGMNVLKEAEGSLLGVASAAATMAAVAGAAIAAYAAESLTHFEEVGHAAYEMHEKFGIAGTDASAWIAVGAQLGIGSEQISKGFQFLSKDLAGLDLANNAARLKELHKELETGSAIQKEHARAALVSVEQSRPLQMLFDQLKISTKDAHGNLRPLQDILGDVAEAFKSGLVPETLRSGDAVKLFGRDGAQLVPLLMQGKDGIAVLMAEAKKMGVVLGEDQVAQAQKLFLAHKQLDMAIAGVSNQFAMALAPAATQVLTFLADKGIPAVVQFAQQLWKEVSPAVEWLTKRFQDTLPIVRMLWEQFSGFLAPELRNIQKHAWELKPIIETMGFTFLVVVGVILTVAAGVVTLISKIMDLADWLSHLGDHAREAGDALQAINPFARHSPSLVDNVEAGTSAIVGHYSRMANTVRSVMAGGGFGMTMPMVAGGVGYGPGSGMSATMAPGSILVNTPAAAVSTGGPVGDQPDAVTQLLSQIRDLLRPQGSGTGVEAAFNETITRAGWMRNRGIAGAFV